MKTPLVAIAVLGAGCLFFTMPASAAKGKSHLSPAQMEADYTRAIESRTAKILNALNLADTNKAARVHDIIIAQWRDLRAWHDTNDAELKRALKTNDPKNVTDIHASLKSLHNRFLSQLSAILTPEQVNTVKDKMTYNKVQFTFKGYCAEYPSLTDAEKQKVLNFLLQAREEAMDAGSSEEKSAIFNEYKGKINNYLAKQGIHSEKWMKAHQEAQKH